MDQLRAMRTFAEVAGRGGFAAAARALDLAPSVVTRLVADLEDQLGARLLTRTTRRVALTPIGQQYLRRAQGILRDVDEAAAVASQGQRDLRGRVRLIAPPLFTTRQLMPRLARLHKLHPGMAIDLTADGPVDSVHESHDISVVVRADQLDGDFVAYRLALSQVLLCAAPGYLRQRGRPQHPHELADHALLVAASTRTPRSLVMTDSAGTTAEIALAHPLLSTSNAELCHSGALAGMGIAALPTFAVQADLEQGRLERVIGDWRLFDVAVHACLPSRRQVPAVVRAMLDFLRAEFPGADHDPWLPHSAPMQSRLRLAA
ncbi:LysR family transcriptional regulator [Rivibacter subsaxonicus]|uniref:DNA-binding transcriptional LysR family regulator n=1 Tax=Rivibacter subsaxonicus TaxID=457575 RepID=A0A4Q7VNY8_9BURK|nr:LysR family transcriptional regulator [Rivibacter subsaxonicus]RZT97838.1 DNA-binding transcriptional LysR family regulator [Rivibacter subsaxonicus]